LGSHPNSFFGGVSQEGLLPKRKKTVMFCLEEERKTDAREGRELKENERVSQFLQYVVEGQQAEAEALLKREPEIALKKSTVTDLSKREFKDITGFQYALWALDWHMWTMLLKYLPKERASVQFVEWEEKGTAYGKHFSLEPLLKALNIYLENYDTWGVDQQISHWCQQVGSAQWLLPAHIVQEYCHPSRSFVPCPLYEEAEFPREMKTAVGSWLTAIYNGGKLGEKFAYTRYNWARPHGYDRSFVKDGLRSDAKALQNLWQKRLQQLESLKAEFVEDCLKVYFPSVLAHTILGYC
jgi:hypothetical protein